MNAFSLVDRMLFGFKLGVSNYAKLLVGEIGLKPIIYSRHNVSLKLSIKHIWRVQQSYACILESDVDV